MPKKILVIDDENDLVEMLSFRLEAAGFEMIGASDGLTGIEKAKNDKPDLILLDLMMPDMDGFAVADKLREDEGTKAIPILLFTAAVSKDLAEKVARLGAVDCITKPFEPAELLKKVRNVLER